MWWVWWVLLIVGVLLLLGIGFGFRKYMGGDKSYWPSRNIYFIDASEIASTWDRWTMKIPFHELDIRMYKAFKNAGQNKFGGAIEARNPSLFLLDLDLIKHVMVKDFDSFVNRRQLIDFSKTDPLVHKMLLMTKDQEWKDLRSTVSPTFTTGKIRRMYEIFDSSSNKLADFLRQQTKDGHNEIDMRPIFTRYTMDVIASAAFGLDSQSFAETESEFCKMAKRIQSITFLKMLKLMAFVIFPKFFESLRIPLGDTISNEFFAKVTRDTIKHRLETGETRDDFLQLLIEAGDSHSGDSQGKDDEELENHKGTKMKLTETHILSQSLLFFFAGFDTTETLLLFASYELAVHQDIQEKLFQEVNKAYTLNGSKLGYDIIMKLEYLDKVISEALRKYPPGFRTERVSSKQYKIPGADVVLDKGTTVICPVIAIHYDEEYYPNPGKFDPERFTPENKAARNPYSYLPFGVGPRNCVAMRFALTEGKAAIAHLILNFRIEPTSRTPIPMKYDNKSGFKPAGGVLWLDIKARAKAYV